MKLAVYEQLKHRVTHLVKTFNLTLTAAKTGRPRKISKLDSLTLALYQHTSTRATKKSVWHDFRAQLKCSYKTLVVAMNEAGRLVLLILFRLMRLNKEHAHLYLARLCGLAEVVRESLREWSERKLKRKRQE